MSLFIDGGENSANAQVLCVHACTFVLTFTCMQDLCVYVCQTVANAFKAGHNRIGNDLGWQGLRAILITPV